ncbi:unnamed protein product [Protopolystoma xenopodis]|uniref:Uncharacterized protein n=1 Tax=Protopolystoma xenopodis TaxID=117903 RepID=A0A3S5BV46_9PLAT|nr:unnamed protein product [Protopolystoma xenopodis]
MVGSFEEPLSSFTYADVLLGLIAFEASGLNTSLTSCSAGQTVPVSLVAECHLPTSRSEQSSGWKPADRIVFDPVRLEITLISEPQAGSAAPVTRAHLDGNRAGLPQLIRTSPVDLIPATDTLLSPNHLTARASQVRANPMRLIYVVTSPPARQQQVSC